MIIVLGEIRTTTAGFDEALRLSLEHVRRSRAEPGCLEHGVHRDAEDAQRLVFVERWADIGALQAHMKLPASRDFVRALMPLLSQPPRLETFVAQAATA